MGSKPKVETFLLEPPLQPLEPNPNHSRPQPSHSASTGNDQLPAASSSRASSAVPVGQVGRLSLNDETGDATGADLIPLSPQECSTLLSVALLQALSSLDSSAFPMPASSLYSAHILPNRPAYIPPSQRDSVVVASSEWKKLAKWMKEAGKDGLLKIKESKGEVTVMG